MEQEGIFKTTAFGGFDKKSVLTYIDALTEKHHAEEEELRAQIEEFTKAQDSQVTYIKSLESQLSEMEGKLDTVATQLEEERAATPHAASEINDLNQQNEELEKKLEDMDRELKIQLERNRQLQFKVEGATYKSQKYDELSAQIGDAMLVAKTNADRLIADARAQAETIVGEAKEQAEKLLSDATEQARILTSEAQSQATQAVGKARASAAEMTEQAEARAVQTIEDAQTRAEEITGQAKAELGRFRSEVDSFKGDTTRLRKSIEEILFVLNDRVDVMQEIVRQMDSKSDSFSAGSAANAASDKAGAAPLEKATDEAGYFGGSV